MLHYPCTMQPVDFYFKKGLIQSSQKSVWDVSDTDVKYIDFYLFWSGVWSSHF